MNRPVLAAALLCAAVAAAAAQEEQMALIRDMRAAAFKHAQASVETITELRGGRSAKCETESCIRGCLAQYDKFDGEECLGLESDEPVISITGTGESTDISFNADFSTVFPNLGSGVTNAALDEFCPCTGVISGFMRTSISVAECVGADLSGDSGDTSGGPTIDQILDFFDDMIGFVCIKNGEDYCQVLAENEANLEGLDSETADTDVSDDTCNDLAAFGCCTASYVEIFQSESFEAIVGESFDDGVAQINAVLDSCGLGDVEPCLKPGQSATYTRATIRLNASFAELSDPTTLQNFKVAFKKDVAQSMDISPLQVEILSVTDGSVVVVMRIRGDVTPVLSGALSAGIPLHNTRAAVPAYAGIEDVDSDDASGVQTEQVTNDADPSPASAFGPASSSLVLLLVAALAAFLL